MDRLCLWLRVTLLCFLLAAGLSVGAMAANMGSCGENVTWSLDRRMEALYISGTGPMTSSRPSAWEGIITVEIYNGVTAISRGAFYDCTSLTDVTIPSSVTSIGQNAFRECSALFAITIPSSVTYIGPSAFERCVTLRDITIPPNVTNVYASTFGHCTMLMSVTIPASVTSIGDSAFYDCNSLSDVYYNGTEAQWRAISIGTNNTALTNATIHYGIAAPTPNPTPTPSNPTLPNTGIADNRGAYLLIFALSGVCAAAAYRAMRRKARG